MSPEIKDMVRVIGIVLGILLSIPVLIAVVQFTRFLGDVKNLAQTTADKLDQSISELRDIVYAHDTTLIEQGKALAVLKDRAGWDGKERRNEDKSNAN